MPQLVYNKTTLFKVEKIIPYSLQEVSDKQKNRYYILFFPGYITKYHQSTYLSKLQVLSFGLL